MERSNSMMSVMTEEGNENRIILVNKINQKQVPFLKCFKKTIPTFKNNRITTSKYNILNFLPLNLMLQFSKMANCYFLILTVMQCWKVVSDSDGVPIIGVPLTLVVGLSMIKDIYEDYIRKSSDNAENNTKTYIGTDAESSLDEEIFKQAIWNNVLVGQIVKVK